LLAVGEETCWANGSFVIQTSPISIIRDYDIHTILTRSQTPPKSYNHASIGMFRVKKI
jgi:hypothetical protein